MPKVKKTKSAKKKSAPKRVARSKTAAPEPSLIERAGEIAKKYALAGAAGVVVILVGLAATMWAGGYFGVLADRANAMAANAAVSAGFEIKRITLKGRGQADPVEIDNAVGPVIGGSLLHFDPDEARARVEELGWVRTAAVSRLFPNTVHVSIREREPAAVWQMSGALHLVDVDGAVIREIGAYEYSYLPLIVGAGAPGAAAGILRALESHSTLREATSALVRVGERRWNMRLRNGLDVKLPDTDYDRALETLETLQDAHGTLDQPLEYIDLRDPDRMVMRPLGEAPEDALDEE